LPHSVVCCCLTSMPAVAIYSRSSYIQLQISLPFATFAATRHCCISHHDGLITLSTSNYKHWNTCYSNISVCLSVCVCRCVCLSVCVCVWFTCLESSENLVDKELNVVVTQTLRFDDVVQISTHQVCHHVTTDHTDHWLLCHPVATDHTDHWSLPSGPCPTICIETGRFVCETLYSQVW